MPIFTEKTTLGEAIDYLVSTKLPALPIVINKKVSASVT